MRQQIEQKARMRTAHSIARTGQARMRDQHLVAANEPKICNRCSGNCNQGRDCPGAAKVSSDALRVFAATLGPFLAAVVIAFLLAAAPVFLDGQGPAPEPTPVAPQ